MERESILKALPSYNASNFSKFQPGTGDKRWMKKPSVYISTDDSPPQQVIKKDRSNILLRYLYQQLDKKNKHSDLASKRKVTPGDGGASEASNEAEPRSKVAKHSERHHAAAQSSGSSSVVSSSPDM